MTKKDPNIIIEKVHSTLTKNHVNYEKIINELGQAGAAEKRSNGYKYTLDDHVKGMIHAMLSNNRPWEPIAQNMPNLDKIFLNYDANKLEKADPQKLIDQVKAINCGNRSINPQMKHLKYNINQFRKIEEDHGTIDNFLENDVPEEIAKALSKPKETYKIKQFGLPLAMEYLKNVGINGMEPGVHVTRICGSERLAIFSKDDIDNIMQSFEDFSKRTKLNMTYLDNLFYIFGAKDYGEICSSKPKCNRYQCELIAYCNYPKNHPL